jgi:hypothetical protein
MKAVQTGSYKAIAGAGAGSGARAETFWKSEPEREQKQIVSAPQQFGILSLRLAENFLDNKIFLIELKGQLIC